MKSKCTNKDLPFGLGGEKIWRGVFCVTMFEYIGLQDDPWSLSVDLVEDMWDLVLSHLQYEIKSTGPVYYVVSYGFFWLHPSCFDKILRSRSAFANGAGSSREELRLSSRIILSPLLSWWTGNHRRRRLLHMQFTCWRRPNTAIASYMPTRSSRSVFQ